MQATALVQVEGVLCASHAAVGVPTYSGKMLTLALDKAGIVVLFLTELDVDKVSHWLDDEMPTLDKFHIFGPKDAEDPIRMARYLGYTVQFLVTGDPNWAAYAFDTGVVPIFMPHPEYARPEFRPDAREEGARPWEELLTVVDKRLEQKKEDIRMAKIQERYE